MPRLDHTAFVNSCRDERGGGHRALRTYAEDLCTFDRAPVIIGSAICFTEMGRDPVSGSLVAPLQNPPTIAHAYRETRTS